MRLIKQLHNGELKLECPSCLNRYRATSSDFKCPLCESLMNFEVTEVIDITPQVTSSHLKIPEPHKDSLVPFVVQEIIMVNPIEPIEVIKKKTSKKKKQDDK